MRTGKHRPGKTGVIQFAVAEISTFQQRLCEIRTTEIHTGKVRAGEIHTAKIAPLRECTSGTLADDLCKVTCQAYGGGCWATAARYI